MCNGLTKLDHLLVCNFVPFGARIRRYRNDEEASEYHAIVQGEGGVGGREGRQDACRAGEPVWAYPNQISAWKKQLVDQIDELFEDGRKRPRETSEPEVAQLYEQIGRLKVELDWLKKGCRDQRPINGSWSTARIRCSVFGVSADCWVWRGPVATTGRKERARRTWRCCGPMMSCTPSGRFMGAAGSPTNSLSAAGEFSG